MLVVLVLAIYAMPCFDPRPSLLELDDGENFGRRAAPMLYGGCACRRRCASSRRASDNPPRSSALAFIALSPPPRSLTSAPLSLARRGRITREAVRWCALEARVLGVWEPLGMLLKLGQ